MGLQMAALTSFHTGKCCRE